MKNDKQPTENDNFQLYGSWITTFLKAQVSAFIGGISDYTIMIILTEFGHIYYMYSIFISGTIGAIINYSINRKWAFNTPDVPKRVQLPKFALVVIGSITLKSSGTYMLTEWAKIDYKVSRLMADAVVAFCFNFMLQKYWVFKKVEPANT